MNNTLFVDKSNFWKKIIDGECENLIVDDLMRIDENVALAFDISIHLYNNQKNAKFYNFLIKRYGHGYPLKKFKSGTYPFSIYDYRYGDACKFSKNTLNQVLFIIERTSLAQVFINNASSIVLDFVYKEITKDSEILFKLVKNGYHEIDQIIEKFKEFENPNIEDYIIQLLSRNLVFYAKKNENIKKVDYWILEFRKIVDYLNNLIPRQVIESIILFYL
jgi:hypothetical protein